MATKDKVLEILTENLNKTVSGEELARICGVSRAAIWKAVNTLRENSVEIEGSTNGGYKLLGDADIFSKDSFIHELHSFYPELSKSHIECFKVIDSTNTYAKKLLSECGSLRNSESQLTESGKKYHKSIFVSESQTAGRGRLGRTFYSPIKSGIYLSVIYAPEGGITEPSRITAFSAIAVCRVLQRLYNIKPNIKWINDIYINNKKIAGILTEGFASFETGLIEAAIIGIGINITDNPEVFPEEVQKIAGSITGDKSKHGISRNKLAAQIAGETLKIMEENPDELIKEYKAASFLIGKSVTVHPVIGSEKSNYLAKVLDIDEKAALIVQTEQGIIKSLNSGEVSLHSEEISKNM